MLPTSLHPVTPARRRWRTWLRIALTLAVVLGLLLNFSPARPPAWWEQVARDAHAYSGESVENRLLKEATLVRTMTDGASSPWSVRVTQEEANAWLRERLPAWIAHGALDTPLARKCQSLRIALRPGRIIAGVQRGRTVLSGALSPEIGEKSLWLRTGGLGVGRLPMPGRVLKSLGEDAAAMRGERPATQAQIKLEDGRVIEVLGIEVGEGWVEVRARTRAGGQ